MALQLSDVIQGVRGRHPAFTRALVPDKSIALFLTGYQRELISKSTRVNRAFCAQQMSVAFAMNAANVVGTAGAGTAGGMPVDATQGVTSVIQAPMGTASELDVEDDVVVLVAESVVASAMASTLVKTGAGWTTDAYVNKWVVITAGTGQGQVRQVLSNTSTQLTIDGTWDTNPDTTSTFEVVQATAEATQTFGAVVAEGFTVERKGYLVKLTAAGVPYIDLETPLLARYDAGIPLPPMQYFIGGTVRFSDPDDVSPLEMVNHGDRFNVHRPYSVYTLGQKMYLVGDASSWSDVLSLDIRFVPIAPALTATTDYFLLPDSAYQAMVAAAAYHAAIRVSGAEGVPNLRITEMGDIAQRAEQTYLREVGLARRPGVIKEWDGN